MGGRTAFKGLHQSPGISLAFFKDNPKQAWCQFGRQVCPWGHYTRGLAWMFCNTNQQVYLVAATGIPQEVLALHRKEHDIETQHVIRGIWQAMHVYQKCWLLAEPRHNGASTYYKCRVASSRPLLFEGEQSLDFFFTEQQLREALDAPEEPIVWDFVEDTYGNEIPVNIAPAIEFYRTCIISHPILWKSWLAQASLAGKQEQSEHKQSVSSPAKPVSLTTYRERKSLETAPVAEFEEKIAFDALRKTGAELNPTLAKGHRLPVKELPLVLLTAVLASLQQRIEDEHDLRERKLLKQYVQDVEFMISRPYLWRGDSDQYVHIAEEDYYDGICLVYIGVHPASRNRTRFVPRRNSEKRQRTKHLAS